MKRMLKMVVLVISLSILTACSSKVSKHAEAIEDSFKVEAQTKETKSTESYTETSGKEETGTKTTTSSSVPPYLDDEGFDEETLAMREKLVKEGKIKEDEFIIPEFVKSMFLTSDLVLIDDDFWSAVVENIDFNNLKEQLKPQYEKQIEEVKKRKNFTYDITIKFPDIEKIKISKLDIALPKMTIDSFYDKGNDYAETYHKKAIQSLDESLLSFLSGKEEKPMQEKKITLTVTENEKEFTAKMSEKTLETLQTIVQRQKDEFLDTIVLEIPEYQKFDFIKRLKQELASTSPNGMAPKIIEVKEKKKEKKEVFNNYYYPVKLEFVTDYKEKLHDIGEKEKKKFKDQKQGQFYPVSKDTVDSNLNLACKDTSFSYGNEKEVKIIYYEHSVILPKEVSEEMDKTVKAEFDQVVKDVTEYIDKEVLVKPQERPGTGVLSGANAGSPITVLTPEAGEKDYFLKFLDGAGNETLTAYIRNTESATINLPAGTYRLRFALGDGSKWYGPEHIFGPDGRYSESREVITVQGGVGYQMKLYGVADGNLPIKGVNSSDF
ncbi:hypothetical protein ACWN8V_09050 [Vagococcus elongatus]|uniref:Lipoprotein n=1 Tax=Vagococcus elongatus TaxID=180344 RepID=A0A430ASN0_9ENTE|nr:hypothetical protein [Vagococcus elongatus]RSU11050.1 hypothetical protein CBF29_08800 [Vagococcus elongatus]